MYIIIKKIPKNINRFYLKNTTVYGLAIICVCVTHTYSLSVKVV